MLRRFLTLSVCLAALGLGASAQEGTAPSAPSAPSARREAAATQSPAAAKTPDATLEYKLLATKKTSTMQKELLAAADEGFQFVGVSVGATFFGGSEVITIMRRPREE